MQVGRVFRAPGQDSVWLLAVERGLFNCSGQNANSSVTPFSPKHYALSLVFSAPSFSCYLKIFLSFSTIVWPPFQPPLSSQGMVLGHAAGFWVFVSKISSQALASWMNLRAHSPGSQGWAFCLLIALGLRGIFTMIYTKYFVPPSLKCVYWNLTLSVMVLGGGALGGD